MWISSAEYARLLTAITVAEERATAAENALAAERLHADKRIDQLLADQRHVLSMFLRSRQMGAYPLPPAKDEPQEQPPPPPNGEETLMDQGEYEAIMEIEKARGRTEAEVNAMLVQEGYTLPQLT